MTPKNVHDHAASIMSDPETISDRAMQKVTALFPPSQRQIARDAARLFCEFALSAVEAEARRRAKEWNQLANAQALASVDHRITDCCRDTNTAFADWIAQQREG